MTGTPASDATPGVAADAHVSVGRRLLAAAYDVPVLLTLFLIGTALLMVATGGARLDASVLSLSLHRGTLLALWIAYYGVSWTRFGQSLGMRVWRLRLTRLGGSRIRWPDALLRLACALLAWLPLALGIFAAAWDPQHRAWHDRLSRTRMSTA